MQKKKFHKITMQWFEKTFAKPTEVQEKSWPLIQNGEHVLISAPTGSGKTLASFLVQIDRLLKLATQKKLEERVYVVYISPLKALSHDIERNLTQPLYEIQTLLDENSSKTHCNISVKVRTGDTPLSERQKMLKEPPHILVTTPESFYLLLTSPKAQALLSSVESVIVDEIHAVAGDKRGSHLALSLERLDRLVGRPVQRVGLSATQKPLDDMKKFLVGSSAKTCQCVEIPVQRSFDLGIETPHIPLSTICSHPQWAEVIENIAHYIQQHKTTLIFVNTRKMSERITHLLQERFADLETQVIQNPEEKCDPHTIACHHGSMSREKRLHVEDQLKRGSLRAVVATASLELGIDIGAVDLVIQIGSPRAIGVFLQRVGRSRHHVGGQPKARIFALTRDELIEAAALLRSIHEGELDRIIIPEKPVDILAQQIVAAVVAEGSIEATSLYSSFRQAFPYRDMSYEEFISIVRILDQGLGSPPYPAGRFIHYDEKENLLTPRSGAKLAALTSGCAIPELAEYRVVTEEGTFIGTLDEEYAVESSAGDIFLLGNHAWRVCAIRSGQVIVQDAGGQHPSIPFWQGEAPGRTFELSQAVSALRESFEQKLHPQKLQDLHERLLISTSENRNEEEEKVFIYENFSDVLLFLQEHFFLQPHHAEQAFSYLMAQKLVTGELPSQKKIIFERFYDEVGTAHLIVHAPFGQRINKAWGLAMRKCYCRLFDFELQAVADDNGFALSLGPQESGDIEALFKLVNIRNAQSALEQAILQTPLFQVRWRWNLSRALAVLRFYGGKKVLPHLQRYRSDDLLTAVFPAKTMCLEHVTGDIEIPDHPYAQQTMHDCLQEAMDFSRWQQLLQQIEDGHIQLIAKETATPSPFAHQLIHAQSYAFLDDVPLENRRTRAVPTPIGLNLSELVTSHLPDFTKIIDQAQEKRPVLETDQEFYSFLKDFAFMPQVIAEHFPERVQNLLATDKAYQHSKKILMSHTVAEAKHDILFSEHLQSSLLHTVRWFGAISVKELAQHYGLAQGIILEALHELRKQNLLLELSSALDPDKKWSLKTTVEIMHRRSVLAAREEIQPVTPERFIEFQLYFQDLDHRKQESRKSFAEGIEQLQGFSAPGSVWDTEILPDRYPHYTQSMLDEWTLSGRLLWLRIPTAKSCLPGRHTLLHPRVPITFVLRHQLVDLLQHQPLPDLEPLWQSAPDLHKIWLLLTNKGALFFDDLLSLLDVDEDTLLERLSELMCRGLLHSDSFASFRQISSPSILKPTQSKLVLRQRSLAISGMGRFSINPMFTKLAEQDPDEEKMVSAWSQVLLARYGILCRQILDREALAPKWGQIAAHLRRLEMRGQVRAGRFIKGLSGEQFASLEAWKLWQDFTELQDIKWQVISAADPCNLFGVITPGVKIAALRHTKILVHQGEAVAIYQSGQVSHFRDIYHSQKELYTRALRVTGTVRRIDPFLKSEEEKLNVHKAKEPRGPLRLRESLL